MELTYKRCNSQVVMRLKKRYENAKTKLLNDETICQKNRKLFEKFFDWEEEKLKRINGLSEIDESSYRTLYDYIKRFKNVNKWFNNKSWKDLTLQEIKNVYNDLEDGKIKNIHGKKFEDRRSYYNKVFKAKPFQLAGKHKEVKKALEFFTDRKKKEVRFVNKDNFKKMVSVLSKPHHLALFWLAWDIGENINSLLKLSKRDFTKQINRDTKEPEYLVHLPKNKLKRSRKSRREPTLYNETVQYLDIVLQALADDDLIFQFGYRQALKIFHNTVEKSKAICEPNGERPSWKDLRSGMACHLFSIGWHSDDINLRLGHSINSKELGVYLNYMAQNRNRAKKIYHNNKLEDIKTKLDETSQREKLQTNRIERQKDTIDTLGGRILELEKIIKDIKKFDEIIVNLFSNEKVKEVLIKTMLKKGIGKRLLDISCK